jgi:hypothetical protein
MIFKTSSSLPYDFDTRSRRAWRIWSVIDDALPAAACSSRRTVSRRS